ncbi:MAG: arginine--tRNA ligase [Bacteroidota bacterium]|nr:arginine--tRNA ligase [Bacteroidota bacterium]
MIEHQLAGYIIQAFETLYGAKPEGVKLETTRQDFEGDYTFVVFPYIKISKKNPEQTAAELGEYIISNTKVVCSFNVVKGFLNLVIADNIWSNFLNEQYNNPSFGKGTVGNGQKVMVEYSSPNTNKPLHLGHTRNNLLGWSVSEILKANGYQVYKANLVNDRGIHICKSMIAWMSYGNGETPESTGSKGDKLVGKYYVAFEKYYRAEVQELIAKGIIEADAEKQAPLMIEAQEMLRKWEASDAETLRIWTLMNGWVYKGFEETYSRMGVDFNNYYYESQTYLLGKKFVEEGLTSGVFYKKADGSVWIDLTADGLDEKLVLRADGTSVYITQDLGTAQKKYDEVGYDKSIYVVANEQDYHFKVLKLILQKLGKPYAPGVMHLSYGMVDLPSGKMKSREGTVVDADELMDEMVQAAKDKTTELGKTQGFTEAEMNKLYHALGMGALKYFLLKVDPQKRMLFNPAESIDLHGNTGPFIQYTHARICSVMRTFGKLPQAVLVEKFDKYEKELLALIYKWPSIIIEAGKLYSPAIIANYIYEVAKEFNRLYHELPLVRESDEAIKNNRLAISQLTAHVLKQGLNILGIEAVERM